MHGYQSSAASRSRNTADYIGGDVSPILFIPDCANNMFPFCVTNTTSRLQLKSSRFSLQLREKLAYSLIYTYTHVYLHTSRNLTLPVARVTGDLVNNNSWL